MNQSKNMGMFEWFLLVILSILWGGSFFFSKIALFELPPFTIVFVRVAIASIALNGVVIATGYRMPLSLGAWGAFLILGVLNNIIPFSLIFWGQTQISSSLASILNATTPIWAVLLAHLFTKDEKLSINRTAGILLGFSGVVIMIGPDALTGLGGSLLAQLAVIAATVSYASAGIFGKRLKGTSPYIIASGQITCSAVMMIPVVLYFDQPFQIPLPSLTTWGALLGLALLSTSVAYVIYFRLLSTAGATNLMLVTFLIPVSASVLGMTLLSERLNTAHYFGMAFIGLGLMAIDGRPLDYFKRDLLQGVDLSKKSAGDVRLKCG